MSTGGEKLWFLSVLFKYYVDSISMEYLLQPVCL